MENWQIGYREVFEFSGFKFMLSWAMDNSRTSLSHCLPDYHTFTVCLNSYSGENISLRVGPWFLYICKLFTLLPLTVNTVTDLCKSISLAMDFFLKI